MPLGIVYSRRSYFEALLTVLIIRTSLSLLVDIRRYYSNNYIL